jgi:hypothetical protein
MKILTQSLLLAAALLPVTTFADDAPGFDVLKSMSVADFRASGLDKLSDAQIKALDAWFAEYQRQHPCGVAAASQAAPAAAATPAAAPVDDSISSYIVGDFRGWTGTTTFKLENGQVWEQVDDSIVTIGARQHAKVTINRGAFNSYYMSVEGVTDSVQVKRIKP